MIASIHVEHRMFREPFPFVVLIVDEQGQEEIGGYFPSAALANAGAKQVAIEEWGQEGFDGSEDSEGRTSVFHPLGVV